MTDDCIKFECLVRGDDEVLYREVIGTEEEGSVNYNAKFTKYLLDCLKKIPKKVHAKLKRFIGGTEKFEFKYGDLKKRLPEKSAKRLSWESERLGVPFRDEDRVYVWIRPIGDFADSLALFIKKIENKDDDIEYLNIFIDSEEDAENIAKMLDPSLLEPSLLERMIEVLTKYLNKIMKLDTKEDKKDDNASNVKKDEEGVNNVNDEGKIELYNKEGGDVSVGENVDDKTKLDGSMSADESLLDTKINGIRNEMEDNQINCSVIDSKEDVEAEEEKELEKSEYEDLLSSKFLVLKEIDKDLLNTSGAAS